MISYEEKYDRYLNKFNDYFIDVFRSLSDNAPDEIRRAMFYAVHGGGKRIRPILCISVAELLGVRFDDIKELALAVEMIHSYSLVHDDLPAMDNDDYRRGKLSTHKMFGEANGILAGDALLNFAFEHVLSKENFTKKHAKALSVLAEYSGYSGMIGGQVLDLRNGDNTEKNEKTLYDIIDKKTAKLITAPLLIASILSDGKYYDEFKTFGCNLGLLFQITDDILDEEGTLETIGKTPHKDKDADKLTAIKVFGLDGAKERAEMHYKKCKSIIDGIDNADFLSELTDKIFVRKS